MNIMDDQREISTAQSEFAAVIHAHSAGTRQISIGFQSGNTDAEVMWLPKFDIWAYLGDPPFEQSPGERFWNVFGIGEPHGMVSITCEINPPKHGINRQAAGGFARDASGAIYLIHRGIINSRGRVPKSWLRQNFRWTWVSVDDGDMITDVMPIGQLNSPEFIHKLRDFIHEVARVKATV